MRSVVSLLGFLFALAFLAVVMGSSKQTRLSRIALGFGRLAFLVFETIRRRSTWWAGGGGGLIFRAPCYSARVFSGLLLFLFALW